MHSVESKLAFPAHMYLVMSDAYLVENVHVHLCLRHHFPWESSLLLISDKNLSS